MDGYKHYIRINEAGTIVHGFSDAFEQPQDGDILVLENGPRHFHLAWPEPLRNERGQYRFRWIDGQRAERSQAELDEEAANQPPAPKTPEQERVEALEAENATLWYEIMLKEARISEHDTEIAGIWYEIMTGGGAA